MLVTEMLTVDAGDRNRHRYLNIVTNTFDLQQLSSTCNPPIISVLVTRIGFVFQINVIHTLTCSSGPLIISLRWKQGPTRSISKAFLNEVVPVLPKPAPITFNSVLDFISKIFKFIMFWWMNDTLKYLFKWIKFYFKNITKDILYIFYLFDLFYDKLEKRTLKEHQDPSKDDQRTFSTFLFANYVNFSQLRTDSSGNLNAC